MVVLGFLTVGLGLTLLIGTPERELEVELPEVVVRSVDVAPAQAPEPSVACDNLHAYVCAHRRILEDPTGLVQPDVAGEVEALRIYEMIIHQHPDWTSTQVDEELVKQIYTDKRRKRLADTFTWVQQAIVRFIEKQSLSPDVKEKLRERIKTTELQLPPPASVYSNEPELFTKNDVYYGTFSNGDRAIRVGGAYVLTAKSLFNRIFTFAHELAHAIDPCDLQAVDPQLKPYRKLTACFRQMGWIPKITPTGGHLCDAGSLVPEVFADWLATEITAEVIELYRPKFKGGDDVTNSIINSVRDLCHQETWLEEDLRAHPSPQSRISFFFGQNTRVRGLLGCAPAKYCSFEGSLE